MNFLQQGLEWFQEQRIQHTTVSVKVGKTTEAEAVTLNATITKSDASSVNRGVTLHNQYFHFIFKTTDLKDISIDRSLKIWYNGDTYKVTEEGRVLEEYNDPLQKDRIVTTVLVNDQTS